MIYDIRLRIGTDYPGTVGEAQHVLRIRPRGDFGQRVEALALAVDPRAERSEATSDFFGNDVERLRLRRPHRRLAVEMRARVTVEREAPSFADTPPLAAAIATAETSRDLSSLAPAHFRGESRAVDLVAEVADYARPSFADDGPSGPACLDLARRIQQDFRYEEGFTDTGTDVATAFSARRGVCQDFAHVMIAGLRGLGLPACYVSGYLKTDPPPGQPRLEGVDAMHAWVMAWLGPETGWLGFDPTNGIVAGDGHIVAAIGRDYADVAPIAGVVTTAGSQYSWHAVDVIPLDETHTS
ncbi:transglutaminase family protein [Consotaella aegiceratis]|uniref:transglutaminase family protein n=1 Tax=Consotaella aegiceratis TaxID=3097961 RepID=UPI002F3ED156